LAESVIGLFKTEAIAPGGCWSARTGIRALRGGRRHGTLHRRTIRMLERLAAIW
jgi:hypothetical protein